MQSEGYDFPAVYNRVHWHMVQQTLLSENVIFLAFIYRSLKR